MKATVLMRQPGRVQEIVGALRRGGGDRLQVRPGGARWGGWGGDLPRGPAGAAADTACPQPLEMASGLGGKQAAPPDLPWVRAHLPENLDFKCVSHALRLLPLIRSKAPSARP